MPLASVSWRRPVPSARIEKYWLPQGFVPRGSQLDSAQPPPLTGDPPAIMEHAAPNPILQPKDGRPSSRNRVSWRRSPPRVFIEKSWQVLPGLVPSGSAEVLMKPRPLFRNPEVSL